MLLEIVYWIVLDRNAGGMLSCGTVTLAISNSTN